MRSAAMIAAMTLVVFMPGEAEAQASGRCKVTDPTGSPLNVREGPQGRVLGTIRNGTVVRIDATATDHNGKPWARIVASERGRTIGWVFREFVSCY